MTGVGGLEDAIASLSRLYYPLPGSQPVAVMQPQLTHLSLTPFHGALSLPYSDTAVLSLLKAVGEFITYISQYSSKATNCENSTYVTCSNLKII